MDDLISRRAAITLPVMPKEHREYITFNLDDAYDQGWWDLQKCIEELPTIRTRRSAIWIREWQGTCCGNCGRHPLALSLVDEIGPEVLSEYCPHCGAHMENWEE